MEAAHALLAKAERAPDGKHLPQQHLRDMATGEERTKDADARWAEAWEMACTKVSENAAKLAKSGSKRESVLVYLYSRLGFECGRFLRLLHAENTSWGTYQDAICHPSQWHCNAHANNLVVLAPSSTVEVTEEEEDDEKCEARSARDKGKAGLSFLSYLDLDMCFSNTDFVEIDPRVSTFGEVGQSVESFSLRLGFEHANFAEVVAGNDASSGVPLIAREVLRKQTKALRLAREILCDVMMRGYLYGYYNDCVDVETEARGEVVTPDIKLHEAAMEIVKIALIKQADYLA